MTRTIWIIGGTLAGFITAFRLLSYGFHICILERRATPQILDHTDVLPPVWPGFFHATWSLLQELPLPLPRFHTGAIEVLSPNAQRCRIPRFPTFSSFHVFPELLLFKGLSWRDRLNLLNYLEKDWESGRFDEAVSDTQSPEIWVTTANQSPAARLNFWNPLCRWLLGCDLSEASLRIFALILTRYVQTTSTGTQWFFGHPSTVDNLKAGLRELLMKQGVRFHHCDEYPPFQSVGKSSEKLSLAGNAFSETAIYVAALSPEALLPLLPERSLTKFAQLDRLAQLPSHTRMLLTFTLPHIRISPSLILCPHHIDWMAITPSTGSLSTDTHVACLLKDTPDEPMLEQTPYIQKTWSYLQSIIHLPQNYSMTSSPPQFQSQRVRLHPSLMGSRTFRPHNASPVPNFFVVGPWTATSLSDSVENLVASANSCAEAIAHRFFSGLR
ncbi:MAG: hypothetical protein R3B74_10905 [Nitrospirales bacterium]|nr:hypothetical protein [Nitrospirales bacterium]